MQSATKKMRLFIKTVDYFGNSITVPEWVNWLAMDKDGRIHGYLFEPLRSDECWYLPTKTANNYLYIAYAYTHVPWKDSKQKV